MKKDAERVQELKRIFAFQSYFENHKENFKLNIRNKQLHDEYRNVCISAFKMLKEYSDKEPLFPSSIEEKIIFDKSGAFRTSYIEKPNLYHFIHINDKELLNLPEFKSFSDTINKDKRLKLLRKIDENQVQHRPYSAFFDFLSRLAGRTGSFKFNDQTFSKQYKEYEDYLYLDTISYLCFCILINFQCDIGKIKLNNGLLIKKISNNERRRIWRMRTVREHDMLIINWIMQVQFNIKRGERFTYQLQVEIFNDLITTLRLFKSGVVGYKHIYSYCLSSWDDSMRASLGERDFIGKVYTLSKSEVYKFKKWREEFNRLKSLKIKKEIEIAIRRFNYAYERVNLEDKLIDYVIAFESLLLLGESEKKFKFAQRGAFLLGKEIKDPKRRYNYMKEAKEFLSKAYKLRSNIVHGSKRLENKTKINKKEVPKQTFIEVIEEYLRKSIKIYLKISTKKKKEVILKDLDDSIFYIN